MKKIIFIVAILLVSCEQKYQVKESKYTLWFGSPNISYGYGTNSFKDSLGFIVFKVQDSSTVIYNKKYLKNIEINR